MTSTGRKAPAPGAAGNRKGAGKGGTVNKKAASKEKTGGKLSKQPISPELQAQLDATQELNPAARRGSGD